MAYQDLCKTPAARKANLEAVQAKAKAKGFGELVESLAKIVSDILEFMSAEIKVLKQAKPPKQPLPRATPPPTAAPRSARLTAGSARTTRKKKGLANAGPFFCF
jgi:hypothetical protein